MKRISILTLVFVGALPHVAGASDADFLDEVVQETKTEKKETSPLFMIPLQPVWKMIEPARIDAAIKNMSTELRDAAGFEVSVFSPKLGGGEVVDKADDLMKRWNKDLRVAEGETKKRRYSQAIKRAGLIVRQAMSDPASMRDANLYCRAMILVAEGELRRGRRAKALAILEIVVSSCGEAPAPEGGAELSDGFADALAEATAEVRRRSAGSLAILADEPNAQVFLNGVNLGSAPKLVRNLPPGRHLVAVVKEGHKPFGQAVKVGSDETKVQARLTKSLGGGKLGRMFTEMRGNTISDASIAYVAELLKAEGGKAELALVGGIAESDATIRVSTFVVNRDGQAVRLKPMSFDVDFLGLAPEMLSYNEKLKALSEKFVGAKLSSKTLIEGLERPNQEAEPIKWASLALGGKARSLAQQGNARGPLQRGRGPKRDEPRARRRTEMKLDGGGETGRGAERGPDARRPDRGAERTPDARLPDRRAERTPDARRPDRRAERTPDARRPDRRAEGRGSRSRSSRGSRIGDGFGAIGDGPKRLKKRRRSRMNWPLIAGASAVGVGVIGGGVLLYYSVAADPHAVNANINWTVPK